MNKMQSLEYYIESQTCVTVFRLSQKLEVSQRTLYRMIRILKMNGVDIQYSKIKNGYLIGKNI
jgi:predicted DNA-binding transcriptional regulator YafY